MPVDIQEASRLISELHTLHSKLANLRDIYLRSLHEFIDGSKIDMTPEQKNKLLDDARSLATNLESTVASLKTALGM